MIYLNIVTRNNIVWKLGCKTPIFFDFQKYVEKHYKRPAVSVQQTSVQSRPIINVLDFIDFIGIDWKIISKQTA